MNCAAQTAFSPACIPRTPLPHISLIASHSKSPTSALCGPRRALSRPEDDMPELDKACQASFSLPLDVTLIADDDAALLSRPGDFTRLNESDDAQFYASARFVHHTDGAFRESLTKLYRAHLQEGMAVLDLCASWDSFLPPEMKFSYVAGHGMNESELQANIRLDHCFVKDLNQDPRLNALLQGGNNSNTDTDAEISEIFDAVLCVSGIPYLTQPIKVLREVWRILNPGGKLIISFSMHCFQEKAVASWLERPSMKQRLELVAVYLQAAGFEIVSTKGGEEIAGSAGRVGDPFAAIVGRKPSDIVAMAPIDIQTMHRRLVPPALWANYTTNSNIQHGSNSNSDNDAVSEKTLEQWRMAYLQMGEDAKSIGIPSSAIPPLPTPCAAKDIRAARDHLAAMIASFISSGL